METREQPLLTKNGWGSLGVMILTGLLLAAAWYPLLSGPQPMRVSWASTAGVAWYVAVWALLFIIWLVFWNGFYSLQPNQAAVLVLFGRYRGTDRAAGLRFTNPLFSRMKVSLRARNLNMQTIKVNDERGNPVEIAAVVVWRVSDSAQATFDVDNFEHFVTVQSEAALRNLASHYPYDSSDEPVVSLRGSRDEVSAALMHELQQRVARAGVTVEEARLSHLAYAPEIAGAMLQRQQAEAIVAARTRIVDGAVGIVEMALEKLGRHETIKLDEERRAAMVNNLLVVLCGDKAVHPVVHAGTLYGG